MSMDYAIGTRICDTVKKNRCFQTCVSRWESEPFEIRIKVKASCWIGSGATITHATWAKSAVTVLQ
eukprot:m.120322 g.120322  ORF g.120322 m.120322 type:complete len:66 (+) comp13686_c0_seq3:2689-2886(+)